MQVFHFHECFFFPSSPCFINGDVSGKTTTYIVMLQPEIKLACVFIPLKQVCLGKGEL